MDRAVGAGPGDRDGGADRATDSRVGRQLPSSPLVAQPPYPDEVFGSVVDLILIVLIIMFAVNGYRQGFLVGALSFVGFFGGALVGLQLAPLVVGSMSDPWARIMVSL